MSEQSKGYWKHGDTIKSYARTCSVCGEKSYFVGIGEYPFCPYCRADMRQTHNKKLYVKKSDVMKCFSAGGMILVTNDPIETLRNALDQIITNINFLETKEIDE